MRRHFGFPSGLGFIVVAGDATCGITLAWRSESVLVLGAGWPLAWGLRRGRRWTFLVFGLFTIGWRTSARSGFIHIAD